MTVKDIYQNIISDEQFKFRIESDSEQANSFNHLPASISFDIADPKVIQDSGIELISGALTGARILYSSDEPLVPAFGPTGAVESINKSHKNSGSGAVVFIDCFIDTAASNGQGLDVALVLLMFVGAFICSSLKGNTRANR